MGNQVSECYRKQKINKAEISMVKEEKSVSEEYQRKTTSDEVLKILVTKRVRDSQQPKIYTKGNVKVSVL